MFQLLFSFKNNRRTNFLFVGIFENAKKSYCLSKTPFLAVNNGFLSVLKNTDQNNICVSIVLKAKTEKKLRKKYWYPLKKGIFEF